MDSISSVESSRFPPPSRIAGESKELSPKEQEEVEKLRERDREVHEHEQAHKMAGGQYTIGAPNYEYKTGPDRKRYAVAGEVKIDSSPVKGNPEATIKKAKIVHQAALAPKNPSQQDRQVAAKASAMERTAQIELASEKGHGEVVDVLA